ncbi:choice-of-anchor D domain-containing protein [Azotobacter chroococcum]|uniref:choice-of-anchor D domain-containing protein n=1 Tax=Azotobacter chroococcum TaxID=353 RepID=UPI00103BC9DF|nr:choice-of-anchor D domain-containing protein [Azotobacter chroococcum]TBW34553.1 choice-of-anchor D domain-containing protein [Azotobacter chroococcum]
MSVIAVNPSNSNVIYMGTAGGGAWRTDDGGVTWIPLFDRQLSLAVGEPGALAIDPNTTDVVYLGTSARVAAQPQAGLFKSMDGGRSWIRLGSGYPANNTGNALQFVSQWINVIIVDPSSSNVLYLASSSGCFRSVDAGRNWTTGANSFGDARSLVLDTSSPAGARILYAGISGRGVFRSNDGGQNWTQILGPATPAVSAAIGPAPAGFGKAIVSVAPPTSPPNVAGVQVLYVTLQGTGGAPDPVGVFMSTDQGANWTQRAATGMPTGTQGGYSFHMAVDPGSPGDGANDILYFAAVKHARSSDSGNNFTALTNVHDDNHSWAFFSQPAPTSSIVFCGNDGGLYRSTDGGVNWTSLSAGGLQTGLFYNLDMRQDATGSNNVGALQDNGTQTQVGAVGLGWVSAQDGDGWDVVYDGTIPSQVYCTSGFWSPAPCTRIWRSTDDGATFPTEITPWGTTSDAGCYLGPLATDPSNGGVLYASGNQNLWQSQNGGNTWRVLSAFAGTGDVDIARTNGNNVAIAVGNQVFASTNALAPTVGPPTGVVFTNITRNLPPRNVARVAFDPNDPNTLYVVLGGLNGGPGNVGHVFRTSIVASAWTDISPNLDVPFNAITLDGDDTPTSIYAGTDFGVLRSVDGGASWSILDDIHFPRVPVFDLVLRNGMLRAATYGRGAFEFIRPKGPSIAVNLEHNLEFGSVCQGSQFLTLKVFNVGAADLVVTSVQRLMGSTGFSVLATPGTPLVISAGEHVDFTVRYVPMDAVAETATIRILSSDPTAPAVDLSATGLPGTARLATAIANNGSFGNACLRSFVDKTLVLNNSGTCPLRVTSISSSSAEFELPSVVSYPLVVGADDSVALPVRFRPASFGAKAATLTIVSNDPTGTRLVAVSGAAPAPELDIVVADMGDFGKVCIDSFKDMPLTLLNSGACTLTVSSVVSSASDFVVPGVMTYPIQIAPGIAVAMPIRFAPSRFGAKSGTITIVSDDPSGAKTVAVSGDAPSGRLVVTGSTCIGGVKACCLGERTITICNVGDCKLHVTSVAFKRKSRHWKLVNNPFPATLHPGSCLSVLIRYKATEKCPRACELVITSDDPVTPVNTLDVMAYTIVSSCCCSKYCDDCHKGCCDKHHDECCSSQAIDGCCDDEGEGCDNDDYDS